MKTLLGIFVILFLVCLPLAQAEIDEHTVAVWLFEEGTGDTVKDVSGNGHDGKFAGKLKWVNGKFGKGLQFPGDASGYVVVDSSKKLQLKELTIEALIKPKAPTGKWQGIICKQQAGCTNRNYGIWIHNTNNVLHSEIGAAAACAFSMDGPTVITDDEWHYVAFTYDGKVGRAYVDGKLELEKPHGQDPFFSDDPITIGVPNLNNANGFLGIIDEARISSVARTEAEIREAMDVGLATLLSVQPVGKLTITWGNIKWNP
ncbi:LamG domain-containing protein [Candidatus Poribacteria bacterium]|nr:LamG domain-containing protein [Candidatus Poribacteria bacterium]